MRLGLHYWNYSTPADPSKIAATLADTAQVAEQAGVSSFTVMDHYFQMEQAAAAEEPMLEGYTTLGYVAGKTERMTLGVLVTGVMYRYPGLLAKIVTTLDVLSGGRARLGIGASWYEREQRGLGVPVVPVSERFERLEETLRICLQMWSDDNGPFQGRHYDSIEKTVLAVRPALADVDAFIAAAGAYANLGVTEMATMPDRHPVEFAEQLAERVLPRLADVG